MLKPIDMRAMKSRTGRSLSGDFAFEPVEVIVLSLDPLALPKFARCCPCTVHLLCIDAARFPVIVGFRPTERQSQDAGCRMDPLLPIR